MTRSAQHHPGRLGCLLQGLVLTLVACTAPPPSPTERLTGAPRPDDTFRALESTLLPHSAAPVGLLPGRPTPLDNAAAAAFFPDPAAAHRQMEDTGRRDGAYVVYTTRSAGLGGTPTRPVAAERVVASVTLYRDTAAAAAAFTDPTTPGILSALGLLQSTELTGTTSTTAPLAPPRIRLFRGIAADTEPGQATYLVQFQRGPILGAVLVQLPAGTDDGGQLALSLAHRQASQPRPVLTTPPASPPAASPGAAVRERQ